MKLGVVFGSASVDAEHMMPFVVDWYRADNTLLIDEALSFKALDTGATSIATMRRLIEQP